MQLWPFQLETLEAISQNEAARLMFLRLAELSKADRVEPLLACLETTPELDEETRSGLAELARDRPFLLAVEDYVRRTSVLH